MTLASPHQKRYIGRHQPTLFPAQECMGDNCHTSSKHNTVSFCFNTALLSSPDPRQVAYLQSRMGPMEISGPASNKASLLTDSLLPRSKHTQVPSHKDIRRWLSLLTATQGCQLLAQLLHTGFLITATQQRSSYFRCSCGFDLTHHSYASGA